MIAITSQSCENKTDIERKKANLINHHKEPS